MREMGCGNRHTLKTSRFAPRRLRRMKFVMVMRLYSVLVSSRSPLFLFLFLCCSARRLHSAVLLHTLRSVAAISLSSLRRSDVDSDRWCLVDDEVEVHVQL